MEAFHITKTKEVPAKCTAMSKWCWLSLWVLRCGTPWVRTTGSNNLQRVLEGCPLLPIWCCTVQETRVVVNRELAPPSWQCSSTFHMIQTFLVKNQTPYSPDMAPCDFWLFTKLKMILKGTQFQTREDIMAAMTADLNSISKEAFAECFQQWWQWWSQGDYLESD